MKTNYYLKLVIGAVLIPVLYLLFDLIFKGTTPNLADFLFLWGIFSNLLIVILLAFYISYSTLNGFKLALAVFAIYYIIGHFNILIEAFIFNVTNRAETTKEMLKGLFIALIFSPIFVYLFNKWGGQSILLKPKKRVVFGWIWRVFLGVFLYIVFYLTAGLILQSTYPGLMEFYKDKIPPVDVMLFTQFPRGLLFVGIAILMLRTLNLTLLKKAVMIGLVFSILGGIAPLIPPNEFMPANIRFVHGIEVGISNFLYGLTLGYLLNQKINSEPGIAENKK